MLNIESCLQLLAYCVLARYRFGFFNINFNGVSFKTPTRKMYHFTTEYAKIIQTRLFCFSFSFLS